MNKRYEYAIIGGIVGATIDKDSLDSALFLGSLGYFIGKVLE